MPRFAGAARGAVVLILSDGLERGDPKAMTDAVKRLAARAWHLSWMSPLAAEPGYRPETAALKSILPYLDALADAGSTEAPLRIMSSTSRRRGPPLTLSPLPAEGRREGM